MTGDARLGSPRAEKGDPEVPAAQHVLGQGPHGDGKLGFQCLGSANALPFQAVEKNKPKQ
jgi:hypothetical protein